MLPLVVPTLLSYKDSDASCNQFLPTFYKLLFAHFLLPKMQTRIVNTWNLHITLSYKKVLIKCWWNWHLQSNSPTFYQLLLRWFPFAKKLHTQIVSSENLCKTLLYEKGAHKMLMKLTPALLQLVVPMSVSDQISFQIFVHFFQSSQNTPPSVLTLL